MKVFSNYIPINAIAFLEIPQNAFYNFDLYLYRELVPIFFLFMSFDWFEKIKIIFLKCTYLLDIYQSMYVICTYTVFKLSIISMASPCIHVAEYCVFVIASCKKKMPIFLQNIQSLLSFSKKINTYIICKLSLNLFLSRFP